MSPLAFKVVLLLGLAGLVAKAAEELAGEYVPYEIDWRKAGRVTPVKDQYLDGESVSSNLELGDDEHDLTSAYVDRNHDPQVEPTATRVGLSQR